MGLFEYVHFPFLDSETLCRRADYGKIASVAKARITLQGLKQNEESIHRHKSKRLQRLE